MKFFYLAHSIMSYICLKTLLSENYIPEFVAIHKNYENEKLQENFFIPIDSLCKENKIDLYKIGSANEIKNIIIGADVGLSIGFMEILKEDIFNLPKFGILNLHCGKLPEYKGRAPICRTIINDEKYLTLTLHRIDNGIDSGDVCNEIEILINDEDNVNTLYKKCSELSSKFTIDSLNKLENGNLKFRKQNLFNKPNRTLSDEERKINWGKNARETFNLIRAITLPYPTAYSNYKSYRYHFLESEIIRKEDINSVETGKISEVCKDFLVINCKDALLKVKKILDVNFKEIDYLKTFSKGEFFI